MKNKRGISLIVLVITIVVIIILAGAVILSLVNNNVIDNASKAKFLSNVRSYETELQLYQQNEYSGKLGQYNPDVLQADASSVTYAGQAIDSKTIYDILPSLNNDEEYKDRFIILDGELVYTGLESREKSWLDMVDVKTSTAEPEVFFLDPNIDQLGKIIKYTVRFSSNYPLSKIVLDGNIKVVDVNNVYITDQPAITIGELTGTDSDKVRTVDITINTSTLGEESYRLAIKAGAIKNSNDIFNTQDSISDTSFSADNIAPINPSMSAEPTSWTNGNVVVTITYTEDSVTKEYSIDGTNWNTYTSPVTIVENGTTVYSRATDSVGNQSGQSTLTVANIDKIAPTVTAENGGTTTSSITVIATASDAGGSGLNTNSYQYSKDNGATWTAVTNATSYTFNTLMTGTYECKVKVSDNTGSTTTSDAVPITTTAVGTITMVASPTNWVNGNVTVTITYPTEIITKQYSTDGTNWNTYTSSLIVTANGTIYSRGYDAGNNQTTQASVTITNIDKNAPTIAFETNGASNVIAASTKVTANDVGGSGISTLKYVWDTQNTVTPSSGWNSFTNASTITKAGPGTYYLWINATDGAGNSTITKSNAFITISPIIAFNYTGDYQVFTAPVSGNYKLEAWGASGGNSTRYNTQYGGKGGYASGTINLTLGQRLYVYIGGAGGPAESNDTTTDNGGWNGGGSLLAGQNAYGAPGGGATDFRMISGLWNDANGLNSRILVAGGGGGANSRDGDYASSPPSYYTGYGYGSGGAGGGLMGDNGTTGNQDSAGLAYGYGYGTGGTQTSGGLGYTFINGVLTYTYASGTFGTGGSSGQSGGGGGWYGGGYSPGHGGGGGGSSYIGGVTNGTTISGTNSGNGKATITFIGQ